MLPIFVYLATSSLIPPFQEKSFLAWMRNNNQFYTGEEYSFRLGIYLANLKLVQQHNKAKKNFKISLNKFATITSAEYKMLLGELSFKSKSRIYQPNLNSKKDWPTPPEELDWREKGAVNTPTSQGFCGSCWAFGAIAACEGCWFLNKNQLLKYSEQDLVDCVEKCEACGGGFAVEALNYVIESQNGQFNLDSDYPYIADYQGCRYDPSKAIGGIRGYVLPTPEDEDDLLAHVAHYGPSTIVIDGSSFFFQTYTSGIYDDDESCLTSYSNHAVCCVGYGTQDDIKYWIVKNSWGAN